MHNSSEVYNVHGVLYAVEETEEGEHGECDREAGVIKVLTKLAPTVKARVKQHELGHAAWWECGAWHRFERAYGETISDEIDEVVMEQFLPVLFNIKREK